MGLDAGKWPKDSAEVLLYLLKNAKSDAGFKSFDGDDSLVFEHI